MLRFHLFIASSQNPRIKLDTQFVLDGRRGGRGGGDVLGRKYLQLHDIHHEISARDGQRKMGDFCSHVIGITGVTSGVTG